MKCEVIEYSAGLPKSLALNKTAVIIDVFRATSVITTALFNGAKEVIPFATPDKAKKAFLALNNQHYILAGEKHMQRIDGFDKGNSPLEYLNNIKNKIILLSTTNGTKAIDYCKDADRIYIASFLNSKIIASILVAQSNDIIIVCSGSVNNSALEDLLCAGRIISLLSENKTIAFDQQSIYLKDFYETNKQCIKFLLSYSSAYQQLAKNGFEEDCKFCLQEDIYNIVPEYTNNSIKLKSII